MSTCIIGSPASGHRLWAWGEARAGVATTANQRFQKSQLNFDAFPATNQAVLASGTSFDFRGRHAALPGILMYQRFHPRSCGRFE